MKKRLLQIDSVTTRSITTGTYYVCFGEVERRGVTGVAIPAGLSHYMIPPPLSSPQYHRLITRLAAACAPAVTHKLLVGYSGFMLEDEAVLLRVYL